MSKNSANIQKLFLAAIVCCSTSSLSPESAHAQSYTAQPTTSAPAPAQAYQPYYVQPAETQPGSAAAQPLPTYQAQPAYQAPPSYQTSAPQAGFFAPINDRIISDPMYLPLKGQIYGASSYSFSTGSNDSYNSSNVKSSNNNYFNNTLEQIVDYGISDDFTVRVAESFAFGKTDSNNDISGNGASNYSNGFENPNFSATYRAIDQRNNHPASVDLYVAYAPDMIDDKFAGGGHDGTEASGRQTATFQVDAGRVMQDFTIEGLAGGTYYGKRNFEYLSNDQTGTTNPYWAYYAGINTQTRLSNRWSVNGDFKWTIQNNSSSTNQSTGVTWTSQNTDVVDLTAALNYHIILNRLVAQLAYENVINSNAKNSYSVPADNYEVKNQDDNIIAVRLLYTFN